MRKAKKIRTRLTKGVAVIGITAMVSAPALADSADALRDLVGARGSSGESELQSRGFQHVSTQQHRNSLQSYWWNESADDCVRVETSNGRYADISDASDQDCGHHEGNTAATVAAVGLGALIVGALATSHRSHHHDDNRHASNAQYEGDYERGYRDGLYNAAYHNSDRSDGYSSGYQAGVNERDQNLSHRRHHRGAGGYQASVNVSDLQGARAAGAMSELERRDFRQVDNFTSGNTRYSIQWNANTRQCLQATIADGRIYDIRDIGEHPNCG